MMQECTNCNNIFEVVWIVRPDSPVIEYCPFCGMEIDYDWKPGDVKLIDHPEMMGQ